MPGGDSDFFARIGQNAGRGDANNPYGVQYQLLGIRHSYFSFISPNEYFDTHPEYFSKIGGIRRHNDTHLCLTNPDVLEIVTKKMLDYMDKHPNIRQFNFSQNDLKFYRDIGVEGLYLQGMGHYGGGGEFSLLRPYYVMKLAWNPDQNPDDIIIDFLQGYYGNAWKPIWEYITLLHDKVEKEDIHIHLYINPAQGYLTDEVLDKARI